MVVATSLARQVEDLKGRATGTDVRAVQRGRGRASLLFTPDEAARIDSESVFEAATMGLEQLTALDNRFKPFFSTLFSPQAPPRELLTPNENKAVSSSVTLFLKLVSPHAAMSSAQYCLEHLIRKHHIHRFEYDEMICCLLPWHDTALFVRAMKLVRLLGGKSARWGWLQGSCKSMTPPPRKLISAQATKDGHLMSLISRWALDASEPSMRWCSFWAAVATEALNLQDPKEHLVRALLPTVLRGLRISSVNMTRYPSHLRDAACLVASALGMRSTLSNEATLAMLEGAIMTCSDGGGNGSSAAAIGGHMRSGILCAVAICRGQDVGSGGVDFPEDLVTKLITVDGIGRELCALSTVYNVLPLLKPVLKVVIEKSVIFQQPPSKLSPAQHDADEEEHGAVEAEQEQVQSRAKEVVVPPPPSYYAQWLREFSLQSGWSNDSLPSLIPWLTLEVINLLSTPRAPSPCESLENNLRLSERNSKRRHHEDDSSLGKVVNKSSCSALLISLSQKYSEEVSTGVAAAAKASPEVGHALSEVLKSAMNASDDNNSGIGSDVSKQDTGLLRGGDLGYQEGYALGLSFDTSPLDDGALPLPLFIAMDHEDWAVRARALQAVEEALLSTTHRSSEKNCRRILENDGDATAQSLTREKKRRSVGFVWRWGGPLSSALLRRAADESPLVASRVLGKRVLRDAVLSVVLSAANSAKTYGDSSEQAEIIAAIRSIVSRVREWTRALIEQRGGGGKEKWKGIISALKGGAKLLGCLADIDSDPTCHPSPLDSEEAEVDECIILQEPPLDLNTGGTTTTFASGHPFNSSNGSDDVTISALAVATLMELLPCALLCLWKDRKAALKVGRATLSAVSKLKQPHPMLFGLSAVEGGLGKNSGGRTLEDHCIASIALSPRITEVSQIMLPFYGAGARLCLARALCEAASSSTASVGRLTSNTVLCASMAVKLLCNDQEVSSGGEFSWPKEIPRSVLSAALVQAVSLFPSPKYPLALGLLYHHKSAAEFLEGDNVEQVNGDDCRTISSNAACDMVRVLFKARLGGERGEGECIVARALGKIFDKQYFMRPLYLLACLCSDSESCQTVIEGALTAAATFLNATQKVSSGPQKATAAARAVAGDIAAVLPTMLCTLASPYDAVRKSSVLFLRCASLVFDKMEKSFRIPRPCERELFPLSSPVALCLPSVEDMNMLLKGLQDVCWGGSISSAIDSVRAVVSVCGEGTVQYFGSYAYYLSHANDTRMSSAFLLSVLKEKKIIVAAAAEPEPGGGVWNRFILPIYRHWLTSQKSSSNGESIAEEVVNCQQHKMMMIDEEKTTTTNQQQQQRQQDDDLAFGKVFGALLSVSGTLSVCQGAYDLLMVACTGGIVCSPCRIAALEVIQRDRCNEELTSEQRNNLMILLLSVGVAEGDADAADAAMRVPISPEEAAALVNGVVFRSEESKGSSASSDHAGLQHHVEETKAIKSPSKKEKRGGLRTTNSGKLTKNSDVVVPLLESCDGSWMNALVCLTERLLEETCSNSSSFCGDNGNRVPLLCALFHAISAVKGKCEVKAPPSEEEGKPQQQQGPYFIFNAEEEHCLRSCMELLEAIGQDGGWSDGRTVINQGHVDAIGEILNYCTTPSTRRCGIRVMANMTEASPVNTMASVMSLIQLLSTSPSSVRIVDGVLSAVLPAVRRATAASVSTLEGRDNAAAAAESVCAQDICLSFRDCWSNLAPAACHRIFRALMDGLGKGSETVVAMSLLTLDAALAEPETMRDFVHDLLLRANPKFQILALSNLVSASHHLTYAAEMDANEGLEKEDILEHNKQLLTLDVDFPPQSSGKNEEDEMNVTRPSADPFLRISLEMWLSGGLSVPVGLMAFVIKHLSSRELHMQVVRKGQNYVHHNAIQRGFLQLCEDTLELLLGLSRPEEDDEDANEGEVFEQYVQLRDSVNETLDLIQRLLDLPAFLALIQALLINKDARVRQRALEMLISRLESSGSFFKEEERSLVLHMLPDLQECLLLESSPPPLQKDGGGGNDEDGNNIGAMTVVKDKQTALLGIQVICRFLGSESGALPKLKKAMGIVSAWLTSNSTASVEIENDAAASYLHLSNLTAALVCLASLAEVLGPSALEYWPQFMPIMLRAFECSAGSPLLNSVKRQRSRRQRRRTTPLGLNEMSPFELFTVDERDEDGSGSGGDVRSLLRNSFIASLYNVTKVLPQFLSPYLQRVLVAISMPAIPDADATRYFSLLVEQVESRLLLPALYSAHVAVLERPVARARLLIFVKNAIDVCPRKFLAEQPGADAALEFALTALEDHELDSKGETAGQAVLVSLVLRLTEKELSSLFHRLCEWGRRRHCLTQEIEKKNDEDDRSHHHESRTVAFLGALCALGESLRALALPFLVRSWPDIIQSLRCHPPFQPSIDDGSSASLDSGLKRGKKRKSGRVDEEGVKKMVEETDEVEHCNTDDPWYAQVCRALACATLCVQHDQHDESHGGGGSVGNERFEDLASAVCDLLGSSIIESSSRESPLVVAIVHCLGTMGTNPPSEEMRRKLMLMVLRRMQDELPCVRVAAVRCSSQIILSAKGEGLSMLPECLPQLQELLEDMDPEVEAEVRQLLRKVEEMLGESIESYMQ